MILITALWHCSDKMLIIYMLSIIRSIQELQNILFSIEGLTSISRKRDLESILNLIMNAKTKEYPKIINPEQYKIYMKDLEFEYFQIIDLKEKCSDINRTICECILDSNYSEFDIDETENSERGKLIHIKSDDYHCLYRA